jgi:hypothetical protein
VFNFAVRISIAISFAFFALVSVGCTESPKGAVAPQQYAEFPGDDSAEGSPGANSKPKTEVDKLEIMAEPE